MSTASYEPGPRETGPNRSGNPLAETPDMASTQAALPAGENVGIGEDGAPAPETELDRFRKVALQVAKQAERNHEQTFRTRAGGWQRAYRAYRNEHFNRSKYLTREYESRSKLFVPKTRAAVRKNQTSCAAALFSTDDVVSVSPERDDDDRQRASAALLKSLLNYRLDRTSPRGGVPWFLIAMGAHQDAQQAGICVTKQDWEYEERQVGTEPVLEDLKHPETGEALFGQDGQPIQVDTGETRPVMKVVKDRPLIQPIPPENYIVDPAAPWYDPVQGAGYLTLRFPMQLGAVKKMIAGPQNPKSRVQWLLVDDAKLKQACAAYDSKGIRMAREGGSDRFDDRARTINDYSIVWVHENFQKFEGCDYHFYSVGSELFLSEIAETEEVYPAFKGARPVVQGYGAIESHNLNPMSPVESWQPLQQEINDSRNLRLDAAKQSVLPFATVKAGKQVDVSVLGKLAPGAHIYVKDHEDITFREIPNGAASLFQETASLNVDMDEQSGSFSGSSVQTNRELNETVGGMTLLSGSANATTEYDLRIFVETWTEPALRQLIHLEQFYENDENVLAIAADKAELFDRYGIDQVTDDLLTNEVGLKVNVGIGATDPVRRVAKLGNALAMLKEILPVAEPKVVPNSEEIVSEVFGAIGIKDGKRLFHWPDPNAQQEPQQDPALIAEQVKAEVQKAIAEIRAQAEIEKANIAAGASIQVAEIGVQGDMAETRMKLQADRAAQVRDLLHGAISGAAERQHAAGEAERGRFAQATEADRGRFAQASEAERGRTAQASEAERGRAASASEADLSREHEAALARQRETEPV